MYVYRLLGLGMVGLTLCGADVDYVAAVAGTKPVAYYRFDAASGKSQVGGTEYKSQGGVTVDGHFAKLDGNDGYLLTTQAGGVGAAASLMAWVNLASLPSAEHRIFYVLGESQNGNDLDLQFEEDNKLKFFTASGGRVEYAPTVATLVGQWHMVVATVDTVSQTRVIYWDGKPVATDRGGGRAGKTGVFSIGASTVFSGRWFKGGIEDAGLWSRALKATEVAALYSAHAGGASTGAAGGMFPTTAKVEMEDANGPLKLKREEQTALMFLTAMQMIERDCQDQMKQSCSLEQMIAGPAAPNGAHLDHLKYDPRTDPNYTYTVAAKGTAFMAQAIAKKPGLTGFCFFSRGFPNASAYYSTSGTATVVDGELMSRSISGDSFAVR